MKKIFKSTISFIIITLMLFSAFAFNVSAATATISGTGEFEVGQNFEVTVRFNADATLYAVEATVTYNASVLKLNKVSGAEANIGSGSVKIVDDAFSATNPSKSSSYRLSFTAIAAGDSTISASLLGGGEAESKASASAVVKVVARKPSSNANLSSIKLSSGALSPAFDANTTNYNVTVKNGVESITVTGAVADGKSTCTGNGTFDLNEGNNEIVLNVKAEDGTKKAYIINVKRMTKEETLAYEEEERNANPLLVIIGNNDYTIVNEIDDAMIPTGFNKETIMRKENEITVLNDAGGKYQLCYLVDANGENGAFYRRDENDNYTKLNYINVNKTMYIIEEFEIDGILPIDYKYSKFAIDGVELEAITYVDEALSDFYVFNCYVPGSAASAYYKYDIVEGTMQRAIDFSVALQNAQDTLATNPQPQPTGKLAWFTNLSTTGKAVLLLIIFVGLALVAVAVLIIVRISSSDNDYEDDGYENTANNDFVFGDYKDEKSTRNDDE